jgi:dTDP-4-amino-4,6-dideoxygalactose transaminase
MNELMSLADASGVPVLEDAAQAAGATYDGKMAGAIGSAASFSFYPRKLREHGSADRKIHTEVGFNSRLDSIQAAALSVFLPQLDAWTKSRRQAADAYGNSSLAGLVGLPVETAQAQSCHHLYVISSDRRDEILMALSAAEIESRVYYSPAIPFQPAMKAFAPDHQLPGATAYENSALALPMGESLSVEDAQRVAAVISSALS